MPFLAFVKRASANPSSLMYSMMSVSLNQLKGLVENYAKLKICIIYLFFFFQKCLNVGMGLLFMTKKLHCIFFAGLRFVFKKKCNAMQMTNMGESCILLTLFV